MVSSHLQRWLTSLVVLPILLYILLKGAVFSFMLLLTVVSTAAHWEFLALSGLGRTTGEKVLGLAAGVLLLLSFSTGRAQAPGFFLLLGMLAYFTFYLWWYEQYPQLWPELALACLGLFYVPFLLGHFLWLWQTPQGHFWVLWLLLVIFAGDTGAFYSGRCLGRTKLYPQVSPGKTVAGAVGGVLASLGMGAAAGLWLPLQTGLPQLLALALLATMVGQMGDLFESMLKRRAQVKDTSSLLPGHGGVLDRLDSLNFTVAVLFYVKLFLS
ncbi:MAG: phosphatidate cytidylyltransferase [Desulfobacca sp.]|uniref:phosphatidate cytidylyltransferase n=1 Tax=Desulfobacca sp. TaxID=2067990 RepID=UPI00404929F3